MANWSRDSYGVILLVALGRAYFGSTPSPSLIHFLIVLRDRLVYRLISLIDSCSRKYNLLTLAYMPMVITFAFLAENFSRIGYLPWSIFGAHYLG